MCLTVYVLAIIHSVYSEELMEQLSAGLESSIYIDGFRFAEHTVKPLITDPSKSGQPLYNGRLTCPRLILP